MANYKALFLNYLDKKGIKYTDLDDRSVRVGYSGNNASSVSITVLFDRDGEGKVQLVCFSIGHASDEKFAPALITCNNMNAKYRWVKFYLDSDQDIICDCDAIVDYESAGEECYELMLRMLNIIDESYPEFMKALWS